MAFRALRREALEREPQAFAESVAEHQATKPETFAARLRASSNLTTLVLGAFVDGRLAGSAGFARSERAKTRHKALIWGVYVTADQRGKGTSRALLTELIRLARQTEGLEQLNLTVNSSQAAAKRLYLSLGFETFGCERASLKVDGVDIDQDHMALRL